jgi:hypothetical protein
MHSPHYPHHVASLLPLLLLLLLPLPLSVQIIDVMDCTGTSRVMSFVNMPASCAAATSAIYRS